MLTSKVGCWVLNSYMERNKKVTYGRVSGKNIGASNISQKNTMD